MHEDTQSVAPCTVGSVDAHNSTVPQTLPLAQALQPKRQLAHLLRFGVQLVEAGHQCVSALHVAGGQSLQAAVQLVGPALALGHLLFDCYELCLQSPKQLWTRISL